MREGVSLGVVLLPLFLLLPLLTLCVLFYCPVFLLQFLCVVYFVLFSLYRRSSFLSACIEEEARVRIELDSVLESALYEDSQEARKR